MAAVAAEHEHDLLTAYLADHPDAAAALDDALGKLDLPTDYIPYPPTPKQELFLLRDELEVFFGGAAGPGKSWGLLQSGLQYVEHEGYHALLLRPQLTEFEQPGGLIEVSHEWLGGTDAFWNGGERSWTFPSKATLRFGYLNHSNHIRRYKGPSYSFVGFDELTGFKESLYRAMFRVLRQPKDKLQSVPVRARSASNPGDTGHAWVKSRFIDPESREHGSVYIRAVIADNPFLDYDTYIETLSHLSPVDRERLIRGDWDVMEEGGKFVRDDFIIVDEHEAPRALKMVRYWDLAASEVSASNPDPDWTVGLLLSIDTDRGFTIRDINRFRKADADVEAEVRRTAEEDGREVAVYLEQEPGASGKLVVAHFKRDVLAGFATYAGQTKGGDKEVRSRPVAAAVANHLVRVIRGRNLRELLDESSLFPQSGHDDIVDALSGAHGALTRTRPGTASVKATRARIPETSARSPYHG